MKTVLLLDKEQERISLSSLIRLNPTLTLESLIPNTITIPEMLDFSRLLSDHLRENPKDSGVDLSYKISSLLEIREYLINNRKHVIDLIYTPLSMIKDIVELDKTNLHTFWNNKVCGAQQAYTSNHLWRVIQIGVLPLYNIFLQVNSNFRPVFIHSIPLNTVRYWIICALLQKAPAISIVETWIDEEVINPVKRYYERYPGVVSLLKGFKHFTQRTLGVKVIPRRDLQTLSSSLYLHTENNSYIERQTTIAEWLEELRLNLISRVEHNEAQLISNEEPDEEPEEEEEEGMTLEVPFEPVFSSLESNNDNSTVQSEP